MSDFFDASQIVEYFGLIYLEQYVQRFDGYVNIHFWSFLNLCLNVCNVSLQSIVNNRVQILNELNTVRMLRKHHNTNVNQSLQNVDHQFNEIWVIIVHKRVVQVRIVQ